MDKIRNITTKILPIYWAFLTYMLLRPASDTAQTFLFLQGMDKVVHFMIFAFLGLLFRVVFYRQNILIFYLIMFSYALLTEILQHTMALGRSFELWDLVADMLGVSVGLLFSDKFLKKINTL